MSGRKVLLDPVPYLTGQAMASSFQGPWFKPELVDRLRIFLAWTGTPAGTFDVQSSSGGADIGGPGIVASIPLSAVITPAGSPDSASIDLREIPDKWIRIAYTATGGSGTLTASILGKQA